MESSDGHDLHSHSESEVESVITTLESPPLSPCLLRGEKKNIDTYNRSKNKPLSLSPGSQLDILSEISNLAAKASWNDNIAAPVKKDQGQTSRKLNLKNVKRATKNKSLQGVKQKKNDKILSQKLMRDLENWETCSEEMLGSDTEDPQARMYETVVTK